ncbi:MAG: HEAT repeat domain-containing protein [Elusimicrobia bacterium]|nr:HEAT repeat domain-containing protein [Elusimicrobiota bacterium]
MPDQYRSNRPIEELIQESLARGDDWGIPELKRRRAEAMPGLIELFQDKTFPKRWWIAHALGLLGDPIAVPALVAALEEDTAISPWAVWALADLMDPRAVAPLIKALKSPNQEIRERAAQVLGKFQCAGSVEALCEILRSDPSWYVRCQAAGALGALKDPSAVPALVEALTANMEDWSHVVDAAAGALAEIDAPLSLKPLVAALGRARESGDAITVVNALSSLCRHDRKPVLEGLESPDPGIRTGCASALSSAGDQDCVAPLLRQLSDSHKPVRDAARATLKAMKARGVKADLPSKGLGEAARDLGRLVMENYFVAPTTEGFSAYRTGFFVHILFSIAVCLAMLHLVTQFLFRSPAAGAAAGGLTVFFLWGVGVWVGVLSHYNPLITLASVVAVVILAKAVGPTAGIGILAGVAGHGAAFGLVRLMRLAYTGSSGTK